MNKPNVIDNALIKVTLSGGILKIKVNKSKKAT